MKSETDTNKKVESPTFKSPSAKTSSKGFDLKCVKSEENTVTEEQD